MQPFSIVAQSNSRSTPNLPAEPLNPRASQLIPRVKGGYSFRRTSVICCWHRYPPLTMNGGAVWRRCCLFFFFPLRWWVGYVHCDCDIRLCQSQHSAQAHACRAVAKVISSGRRHVRVRYIIYIFLYVMTNIVLLRQCLCIFSRIIDLSGAAQYVGFNHWTVRAMVSSNWLPTNVMVTIHAHNTLYNMKY